MKKLISLLAVGVLLSGCLNSRQIPRTPQDMKPLITENCVEPQELLLLGIVPWTKVFHDFEWSDQVEDEVFINHQLPGCKKVGYCADYNWRLGQKVGERVVKCLDNDTLRISFNLTAVIKIVTHLRRYYWGKLVEIVEELFGVN